MVKKSDVHDSQRAYVNRVHAEGFDYGLTVADAFVRSIRDLGYKSAGTALDELIDNSIEAGATQVHVAFEHATSDKKPSALAVIDDGYGMIPSMIRASAIWGGTHREGSRDMFGRYGYGLPSASVSQGKKFTIFSRPSRDDAFYAVELDLDVLSDGGYLIDGRVVVPEAAERALPMWVSKYLQDAEGFDGGEATQTVVVWDKLDKLTWKTTSVLEQKLLEHLGLVYRNFLTRTQLRVNGKLVQPIDPLFVTPGYRFYDLDEERAEALEPLVVGIKDSDGVPRNVAVRFAYMPPTFGAIDKMKDARGRNANPRFEIRKENAGFVVCRNGRQIDVVGRNPFYTFGNNDRYIGLEIDFPAELDEEFGVTTAKQQITISQRIWDIFKEQGVFRVIDDLRRRSSEERNDRRNRLGTGEDGPRVSETVMAASEGLVRRRPPTENSEKRAAENLDKVAKKVADDTGLDKSKVKEEMELEASERPYKVEVESIPGGPFFRGEQRGGQFVLLLNSAHPFYSSIYSVPGTVEGAKVRTGIELLLFVIAQSELDAPSNVGAIYVQERVEWSKRLAVLLGLAEEYEAPEDAGETTESEAVA